MTPLPAAAPISVGVVIPCYNARPFVADAIRSALSQTIVPAEIIVVDDGSNDGTDAEVMPFGPQVTFHRQNNAGASAARNFAVEHSRSDLIAFLDADDVWEPEKLAVQIAALVDRPDAVMCHTQMRFIDGSGRPGGLGWGGTYTSYDQMLLGCGICTSSVLVRRDTLLRVGPFHRRFEPAEDYDLWLRLARLGPMVAIDQPLVRYRLHQSNLSRNYLRTHRAIVDVLNGQMDLVRSDQSKTRVRTIRVGLRRTNYSTARHAMFAMVDSFKAGSLWLSLRHFLTSVAIDPAVIPVEFFKRAVRKVRRFWLSAPISETEVIMRPPPGGPA